MELPSSEPDNRASPPTRRGRPLESTDTDLRPPRTAFARCDSEAARILYALAINAGGWAPPAGPDSQDTAVPSSLKATRDVYRYIRAGPGDTVPAAAAFATVLEAAAGAIAVTTWTDRLISLVRVPTDPVEQPSSSVVDDATRLPPVSEIPTGCDSDGGDGGPFLCKYTDDAQTLGADCDIVADWWSREDVCAHLRGANPEFVSVGRVFASVEQVAFERDDPAAVAQAIQDAEPEGLDTDLESVDQSTGNGGWW